MIREIVATIDREAVPGENTVVTLHRILTQLNEARQHDIEKAKSWTERDADAAAKALADRRDAEVVQDIRTGRFDPGQGHHVFQHRGLAAIMVELNRASIVGQNTAVTSPLLTAYERLISIDHEFADMRDKIQRLERAAGLRDDNSENW